MEPDSDGRDPEASACVQCSAPLEVVGASAELGLAVARNRRSSEGAAGSLAQPALSLMVVAFRHGNFDAFRFSAAECDGTESIEAEQLAAIAQTFYETGLVLLADVLPCEVLDMLKPRLEEDTLRQLLAGEWPDIPTSDTTLSNPNTPPRTHPGHCARCIAHTLTPPASFAPHGTSSAHSPRTI